MSDYDIYTGNTSEKTDTAITSLSDIPGAIENTIISVMGPVAYLSGVLDAALDACQFNITDFSAKSSMSVEATYSKVSNDSISLDNAGKLIGHNNAELLRNAAQLFEDTDAALSTQILQSLS